jgi:hypothetical protein
MAKTKTPAGVKPTNTPWWQPDWTNPFRFAGTGGVIPGYQAPGMRSPDIEQAPWFNPYGPATVDPYFTRWQQQQPSNVPPAATATPVSAAPNVPPYNPQPNPYALGAGVGNVPQAQEYAPNNTGIPAGASGGYQGYSLDDWYRDYGWRNEYETPAYMWNEDGTLSVNPNATGGAAEPVLGWTSVYSRDFYANQRPKEYTWVGGREGGASSKGGGRMPSRYYIPQQQFYKTPGGKTYASRDGYKDAFGEDENPPGNNKNLSIPAWVGPLVSWRT